MFVSLLPPRTHVYQVPTGALNEKLKLTGMFGSFKNTIASIEAGYEYCQVIWSVIGFLKAAFDLFPDAQRQKRDRDTMGRLVRMTRKVLGPRPNPS